jgi:hypothetical protein
MLLFIPLQSAIADVDDVITENGGINETNPSDGSDESAGGGGDDVPWWKEALDTVVDIGVDLKDQLTDIGKDISNEWNDFLDSSEEFFSDVSDWFDTKWNEAGDWIQQKWNEAGDWLDKNKWAQTIIAAVIATVVIVAVVAGLATLGVIGAISLAVVVVIGVGALAGGFIYQWIAGDDYSFLGALGSSTVGGILGYLGMVSGAFASAGGWLRGTAWPAVQGWVRNTAVPWITGKWQAGVNWVRTVAIPFIRTKFSTGVNFVRTKFTVGMNWMRTTAFPWMRTKVIAGWNFFKANYTIGNIFKSMKIGGFISGAASATTGILTGDFNLIDVAVDTFVGALTGGILGPYMAVQTSLSGISIASLSLYGGLESTLGDGLKEMSKFIIDDNMSWGEAFEKADWLNPKNFILGSVIGGLALKFLGPFLERFTTVKQEVLDYGGKTFEELVKKGTGVTVDNINEQIDNWTTNETPKDTGTNNEQPKPENQGNQTNENNPQSNDNNTKNQTETGTDDSQSKPVEKSPVHPNVAPTIN